MLSVLVEMGVKDEKNFDVCSRNKWLLECDDATFHNLTLLEVLLLSLAMATAAETL